MTRRSSGRSCPTFTRCWAGASTPAEWYLRLMFLKFRDRLGYESLCAEVADSISWRRFRRIPLDGRVPHPTTLMKLTTRCGEAAVAGLNEALLAKAAQARLLRTGRLRADTTVVPANVAYPTDSGLLARAVRRIAVLAGGSRPPAGRGGPGCGIAAGWPASARTRSPRSWGCAARSGVWKRRPPWRESPGSCGLAERAAADARRLLANARRALRRAEVKAAAPGAAGGRDPAAGRRRGRLVAR